jgi:carbamoyltransferase
MVILGINAYHGDSSACVLVDGRLVAAAEEERFRRVKHWAGFPSRAIDYCLGEARVRLSDVDHVAVNQDARANLWRKVAYTALRRPEPAMVLERLRRKRRRARVEEALAAALPGQSFAGKVHAVEHHLAHLASAYLVSPFPEAVAVSVDGFGDFASAAWGPGRGGDVRVDDRIYFPHSLGIFYEAMTRHLGFAKYGDEYKVMGLAPYGEPRFMPQMRRLVRLAPGGKFSLDLAYFRHHREKVAYQWENGEPLMGNVGAAALEELLGPARPADAPLEERHRDIARSTQAMYEEAFFHLLEHLSGTYRMDALALAGGCAMNSVANGKVYARSAFRKLYVQAAAGDAGGAIGAAFVAWRAVARGVGAPPERFVMRHAYWGPAFDAAAIARLLEDRRGEIQAQGCVARVERDEGALCRAAAEAIAEGHVVGWFQGRMEWGPRALGNRSILGDPRRADMKDILNLKIKRRESFRPFAPSILREATAEWFTTDDDVPFMMQVYPVREEKRALVPAVTHVDGSGRLHTVTERDNPRYHRLIAAFRDLTGVPMVLNTSFNENEPVVCAPGEALDCFLRTRMDLLVLGETIVRRSPAA